MKKLINKGIMMLMFMAVMSLGMASCSKDGNEPDGGGDGNINGGKMTGWVKIDGKKTDFKFCFGFKNESSYGTEIDFGAWSKDPSKVKKNDKISYAGLTVGFNPDGSLSVDDRGNTEFDLEVYIDTKMTEDGTVGGIVYVHHYKLNAQGITARKDGDKYVIDGKDVLVDWGPADEDVNLSDLTNQTKIDFHFEGTPTWMEEE